MIKALLLSELYSPRRRGEKDLRDPSIFLDSILAPEELCEWRESAVLEGFVLCSS